MKQLKDWGLYWALCIFIWFTGAIMGAQLGMSTIRTEAIEHDVAEWRVDSKTGVTSFHWLRRGDV